MNKVKSIAGVLLVLLVGVLAGSLGTGAYLSQRMERFSGKEMRPPGKKAFLMRRLATELDLTETQRGEIEKILEDAEDRIFAIRREYLPKIREIHDESFALMKDHLNPKQQEALERLHEKLKHRHSRALAQSFLSWKTPEEILAGMKTRLELTEEQTMKVRPLLEENEAARQKILDVFKGQAHPEHFELKARLRSLEKSFRKRLAEILSEEQMARYREMQDEDRLKDRLKMRRPGRDRPHD
jgi:hypothetical protein